MTRAHRRGRRKKYAKNDENQIEIEMRKNDGSLYGQSLSAREKIIAEARAKMVDPDSWDPPAWYLAGRLY